MTKSAKNLEEAIKLILFDEESLQPEMVIATREPYFWKFNPKYKKDAIKNLLNLFKSEMEAHDTEDGYCCACDYDIACMEEEIEKQVERRLRRRAKG